MMGHPLDTHESNSGMHWLVSGAQPNDSLFLHYSGHGSQAKDHDSDEVDGYDETICPVDYARHGCQMATARFLYHMCLALGASGLWLRYATLQNLIPSFPWIAPPMPSTLAQSKERKGSNFAIWQP